MFQVLILFQILIIHIASYVSNSAASYYVTVSDSVSDYVANSDYVPDSDYNASYVSNVSEYFSNSGSSFTSDYNLVSDSVSESDSIVNSAPKF